MRSVVFFVLLAVLLEFVDCKKMWGSRKKREDAEQVVVPPTKKSNIFEANKGKSGRSARRYNSPIDDSEALDSGKFQEMFNLYLNSFEELLESEDFDAIVNPGSIRSMMLQFSGGADIPELSHLLNMPELNNPDILKATMREGLSIAKTSGAEIFALINDPDKMEELVGQLPSEVKDLIAGLSTGDFSKLKDFVNLPGELSNGSDYCSSCIIQHLLNPLCRAGRHAATTAAQPAGRQHGCAGG